jgi:hypothetical protein
MNIGDIVLVKPRYECISFYAKIISVQLSNFPYSVAAILNSDYSPHLHHKTAILVFASDEVSSITDQEYMKIQKVLLFK